MKTMTYTSLLAVTCGLFAFAQISCEKASGPDENPGTEPEAPAAAAAVDPAIEAVFVDSAPEGAVTVLESRQKAEPGSTITISGRIAGAMEPFSADFATLVLADESLKTCERIPGDACPTPWDACCADPKVIAASRLTVQVIGEDGRPIAQSLKLVRGMKELNGLTVTGTVAEGSNSDNLILNATGIHLAKP